MGLGGPALHVRHLISKNPLIAIVVAWLIPSNKLNQQRRAGSDDLSCCVGLSWRLHCAWWPYKIPQLGFEDLLEWIMNGSSVYCECMFDYILQLCLGQMASIMQGRSSGFLEVVHPSGLVGVTGKHKFMGRVYSRVSLIVAVEYVEQLTGQFLQYAWCLFSSNQHDPTTDVFSRAFFCLYLCTQHFHVSFQFYLSCVLTC